MVEILKKEFSEEGYIKTNTCIIQYTGFALQTLSRVFDNDEVTMKKGLNWLKRTQNQDGSWGKGGLKEMQTSAALLCLISAGEGLKISKEEWKKKESFYIQKLKLAKSNIIVTSPLTNEFGFKRKINEMMAKANNRLWICSRFITEFYPDIIKLKKERPEIDVRIVAIPKKDAKQAYSGEGKKFVEPTFDNFKDF